jgi:hypothetical protein
MLYAIKHNKIKRELFKDNEDSLTAAVFERLMYLPSELMQHILQNATYQQIEGLDLHQIESIDYWPSWNAKDTSNTNRIEPDLIIRTSKQDILIEAKRNNRFQQRRLQWHDQIQAYLNEYEEDDKPIIYIALGGLHTTEASEIECRNKKYKIYKSDWSLLLNVIKEVKYDLEGSKHLLSSNFSVLQIINDLILCFALYGFSTSDWFERFLIPIHLKENSLKVLTTWKK